PAAGAGYPNILYSTGAQVLHSIPPGQVQAQVRPGRGKRHLKGPGAAAHRQATALARTISHQEDHMTFVRYEPWALVNRLHRQFDRVLADTLGTQPEAASSPSVSWIPRVDIYEESDRFVVLADVPGVEPKDISITAEAGVLTIRGERRSEKKASDHGYE